MRTFFRLSSNPLTIEDVCDIIDNSLKIELSEDLCKKISSCRDFLERKISESDEPIYGINTGFGSLSDMRISTSDLETLQKNLVMSHACGTGREVPLVVVKIMMILKIKSLSLGHSGVQLSTVMRLIEMFNEDIIPVVFEQGSLGASGDLSPLAHLTLPLIGMGDVYYKGEKVESLKVLKDKGITPLKLKSKEGLAMLNGTQFMSAMGVYSIIRSSRLMKLSDIVASISLDAYDGRPEPFNSLLHSIRPHRGQIETASEICNMLNGSEILNRHKIHVQDPYSFRCIPQVHGASKDALNYVRSLFQIEINSVTDNPTIFPDEDLILSGGNFHGQPLAIALDLLSIAVSEIANISERRVYRLLSGKRGLPLFLVANPGLNSGFMIPQYSAASIVSQNKQLCFPASVDSIESSQGQEDHVSMGANAALKTLKVIENSEKVIAIELFNAVQALEFRRPARSSGFIETIVEEYRKVVPFIKNDKVMYPEIEKSVKFIRNLKL